MVLRKHEEVQRKPFRYGYFIGFIFTAGCFWWLGAATLTGLVVTVVVLSGYSALWFLLCSRSLISRTRPDQSPHYLAMTWCALVAAAFWVTLEWLRSWFLTGFNWNELGVSQTNCLHLRQLAAVGGVPLLSFVIVMVNILVAEALLGWNWQRERLKSMGPPTLLVVVILAGGWIYGWHRLQLQQAESSRASLRYACIQSNIPELPYAHGTVQEIAQDEDNVLQIETSLSLQAIKDKPDLLIWPETLTLQRFEIDPTIKTAIAQVQSRYQGEFLFGSEELKEGRLYNCAYLLGPAPVVMQRYRKTHLVLVGEFFPFRDTMPWLATWIGAPVSFTAGTEIPGLKMQKDAIRIAPFICYEDTQPEVANRASLLHPDVFVTLSNDGWYPGMAAEWELRQHLQNSVLRSIEHDRAAIHCTNNGITCEISPDGSMTAYLGTETQGILQHQLFLRQGFPTLYERWGDWVGWLCRLVTVLALIRSSLLKMPKLS